ncbi:MAG: hypothetical protein AAGU11_17055, partial [Syntrophobacteraceae bacterium]
MSPRIKVRGIYSTALTKLALDSGFEVVEPSDKIRERFPIEFANHPHNLMIQDREDLQGVEIKGEADQLTPLLAAMRKTLIDLVIVSFLPTEDDEPRVIANV